MKDPVRVAVTGAAGQIGYSLLFRIASGAMLGPDQPVILQLLEITPALGALDGVAMELDDCAFPLLAGMVKTDDRQRGLRRRRRTPCSSAPGPAPQGMERADLLEANGAIFTVQGKALSDAAADDVRILVVGNPANTNALIAMNNAPSIAPERFTAMTRLDHNRAMAQLAAKTGSTVNDITKMTIWGNHSATQYPDLFHAEVGGKNAAEVVGDQAWLENDVHPDRAAARCGDHRGPGRVVGRVGAPTPPSTTSHAGSPAPPTATGCRWRVPSDGSYGVPEGLISSFPCTMQRGRLRDRAGPRHRRLLPRPIDACVAELAEERDTVDGLGLI